MPRTKNKSAIADFEKCFQELEKIVTRMEIGEQTLDASLKDFEKGMELSQSLREALSEAEQKVQILVKKNDNEKLEDFNTTGEGG